MDKQLNFDKPEMIYLDSINCLTLIWKIASKFDYQAQILRKPKINFWVTKTQKDYRSIISYLMTVTYIRLILAQGMP
jgi:hypothetical protein